MEESNDKIDGVYDAVLPTEGDDKFNEIILSSSYKDALVGESSAVGVPRGDVSVKKLKGPVPKLSSELGLDSDGLVAKLIRDPENNEAYPADEDIDESLDLLADDDGDLDVNRGKISWAEGWDPKLLTASDFTNGGGELDRRGLNLEYQRFHRSLKEWPGLASIARDKRPSSGFGDWRGKPVVDAEISLDCSIRSGVSTSLVLGTKSPTHFG